MWGGGEILADPGCVHTANEFTEMLHKRGNKVRAQAFYLEGDQQLSLRAMQGRFVIEAEPTLMEWRRIKQSILMRLRDFTTARRIATGGKSSSTVSCERPTKAPRSLVAIGGLTQDKLKGTVVARLRVRDASPAGVKYPAIAELEETPAGKGAKNASDTMYVQMCDDLEQELDITKLERQLSDAMNHIRAH